MELEMITTPKHHRTRPGRPALLLVSTVVAIAIGLFGLAAPAQAGATIELNSTNWSAPEQLNSTTMTVATNDRAPWSAISSAPTWLLATPSGPAELNLTVLANPGAARAGTVTVASASGPSTTVTVTQAPASTKLSYVALGDSFSTGQGVLISDRRGIRFDTADGKYGDCGRSRSAFPKLLEADESLQLTLTDFKACGGATTADVTKRAQTKANGVQIAALSDSTDIVSLTIGGNDIGFADTITTCIFVACTPRSSTVRSALNAIDRLTPALTGTYQAILDKAPNATVYVTGYPQISPSPGCAMCLPLGSILRSVSIEIANSFRQIFESLNAKIAQAVAEVGNPRLVYVDVTGPESPFAGHDLCARTPYLQNLVILLTANGTAASFHPNKGGNEAYAKLFSAALKS
jgi:lysophospholipase L1-like esterase